jgi:hypothetical protein
MDWAIVLLLVVEAILFASERREWFAFNQHKGYTVLVALGVACGAVVALLLTGVASLLVRRRMQFSVRSLLLLVVAIAIPCCWLALERQRAARQQAALLVLREFPGIIKYDFDIGQSASPVPSELRDYLGSDFFRNVERVCLGKGDEFTDAKLSYVSDLPGLKSLTLNGAAIGDEGLRSLRELLGLEKLHLSNTRISDAGLVHLTHLVNLRQLRITRTQVTDAGVEQLQRALPDCKIAY